LTTKKLSNRAKKVAVILNQWRSHVGG